MSKSAKIATTFGGVLAMTAALGFSALSGAPFLAAHAAEDTGASIMPEGYTGKSGFGLGRAAAEEEIEAWNIDVRPDGLGLPPGKGNALDGEEIFAQSCAVCHGDFGEGVGRWPVLSGGFGSLSDDRPVKTVGSYWPYLSTVFDYVHRAMPFGAAQSLTDDEVYAITAYLLYLNGLAEEDFELSNENFTEVKLPNEGNFYLDDREQVELPEFRQEPCMENCKENVEITARAAVVDVTPGEAEARKAREESKKAAAESGTATDAAPAEEPAAEEEVQAAPAEQEEAAAAPAEPDPELVAAGEKLFRQCKACHQVGDGAKNRTGPMLNGVLDAPVGHVADYRYSKVFKEANEAGETWTRANLDAFLADPRGEMKGTKMSFRGVKKPEDREAIITFLSTFR